MHKHTQPTHPHPPATGVIAGGFLSQRFLGLTPSDVKVDTYSKGKYSSVLGQTGGWEWLQRLLKVRTERARCLWHDGGVLAGPPCVCVP
jgi:hypothetical protein